MCGKCCTLIIAIIYLINYRTTVRPVTARPGNQAKAAIAEIQNVQAEPYFT